MAIIYSYPVTAASMSDVMVVSDVSAVGKPTKSISVSGIKEVIDVVDKITDINGLNGQTGDIKLSGSSTIDIDFNAGVNSITFDTTSLVPVTKTATKDFLPIWSQTSGELDSSVISQDINAPSITINQGASLVANEINLSSGSIQDLAGEKGSAKQVLSSGTTGGSIEWITLPETALQVQNNGSSYANKTATLNFSTNMVLTPTDSGTEVEVSVAASQQYKAGGGLDLKASSPGEDPDRFDVQVDSKTILINSTNQLELGVVNIDDLNDSDTTNDSNGKVSSLYLANIPNDILEPTFPNPLKNTFVGIEVGPKTTSASENTLVGAGVAVNMVTANKNTFVGVDTGSMTTENGSSTYIGHSADGKSNDDSTENVAIGASATAGYGSVAIGYGASASAEPSVGGIAIGTEATTTTNDLSLGSENVPLALTAVPDDPPSILNYLNVKINGTAYIIALHQPPVAGESV